MSRQDRFRARTTCESRNAGCLGWATTVAHSESGGDPAWRMHRVRQLMREQMGELPVNPAADLPSQIADAAIWQAFVGPQAPYDTGGMLALSTQVGGGVIALGSHTYADYLEDPPNVTGGCCVESITADIKKNPVGKNAENETEISWSVTIVVKLLDGDGCDCACCEVQFFISSNTTRVRAGGARRVWDWDDLLPKGERSLKSWDGAPIFRPTAFAVVHTPFTPSFGFPGGKSAMLLHYPRAGKWNPNAPPGKQFRGPAFVEDIGFVVNERNRRIGLATTPKERNLGVLNHPSAWLIAANKWSRNALRGPESVQDAYEKIFNLIESKDTAGLDEFAVRSGSSLSGDTNISANGCEVTITDRPSAGADDGETTTVHRTYLVTVTPIHGEKCSSSGDAAEKEFRLSGEITGGVNDAEYQTSEQDPTQIRHGQTRDGPSAPPPAPVR